MIQDNALEKRLNDVKNNVTPSTPKNLDNELNKTLTKQPIEDNSLNLLIENKFKELSQYYDLDAKFGLIYIILPIIQSVSMGYSFKILYEKQPINFFAVIAIGISIYSIFYLLKRLFTKFK